MRRNVVNLPPAIESMPFSPRSNTVSRRADGVSPSPCGSTRTPAKLERMRSRSTTPGSIEVRDSLTIWSMSAAVTCEVARIALVGLVRRADEQRALPRVRELHAAVPERRRQRGLPWLVQAHDHVRALGEAQRARRGWIGHAPQVVHPRPGGVDDARGVDRQSGAAEDVRAFGTDDPPTGQPQRPHLDACGDARPGAGGGASDGDRHARVVGLVVDVAAGRAETVRAQGGTSARAAAGRSRLPPPSAKRPRPPYSTRPARSFVARIGPPR